MKVTLLNLESPDSKHPKNTLAVASVAFAVETGETVIVNDYRLVKNAQPGPNWVAPPTRWGSDGQKVPLVVTTRKVLREVEQLIMNEYERRRKLEYAAWEAQQTAAEAQAKTGSSEVR
jgi:hypothetical protein